MGIGHNERCGGGTNRVELDETGASAVEYALLISGIAAIIVASLFLFGGFVDDMFQGSCDTISTEVNADTCQTPPP